MKQYLVFISILVALLTSVFPMSFQERPDKGLWAMKGKLLIHPFPDKLDSLSGQEIFELQDDKGLTIWFCRYIFKDVCMDKQCQMIRLWLFWDGAGNYLGIQLPDYEPLTKSDHAKFTQADYENLNAILRDTSSMLKDLKIEGLTAEVKDNEQLKPDAITGATLLTIKNQVVQDAVYTCYTLWHSVYGLTYSAIKQILDQRANTDYLSRLFESSNPLYVSWAISYIENHPEYHADFYPIIISHIKSSDVSLARQALRYFRPDRMSDATTQRMMASVLPDVDAQSKYDLVRAFAATEKNDIEVVVTLLELFENHEIGVGSLNLIYSRLLRPEYLDDQRIEMILNKLANSENSYIRNLTDKLLGSKGVKTVLINK
jgi:hypothetical protein